MFSNLSSASFHHNKMDNLTLKSRAWAKGQFMQTVQNFTLLTTQSLVVFFKKSSSLYKQHTKIVSLKQNKILYLEI